MSKRKHEVGMDEPKAKRLTLNEKPLPPLVITDLNEDVLDKIFSYLNVKEWIDMIESDERFLSCSRRVFRTQHLLKCLQLPLKTKNITSKMDICKNAKFLRYFGESITKMEFRMNEDDPIVHRIYHLIITNCRETLINLKILCPSTKLTISKSFKKLKSLNLCYGSVDRSMGQLNKWFPVLENLSIACVSNTSSILNQRIGTLKWFSLDLDEKYHNLHINSLNNFIESNPQLEELHLTLHDKIMTETNTYDRLHHNTPHPEKSMAVKLNLPFNNWGSEYSTPLAQLQLPVDRIECLEISAATFTLQICSYATKFVNLKSLKLTAKRRIDSEYLKIFNEAVWIKTTPTHDCLTHLEISMALLCYKSYANVAVTTMRHYLERYKNLKTLAFIISRYDAPDHLPMDVIQSRIDLSVWAFTYTITRNEICHYVITIALNKL